MNRFIAAEGPVCTGIDQVESLRPAVSLSTRTPVGSGAVPVVNSATRDIAATLAANADLLRNLVNGHFGFELADGADGKRR